MTRGGDNTDKNNKMKLLLTPGEAPQDLANYSTETTELKKHSEKWAVMSANASTSV